jgi:2-dehydropantoate 2-reductase
MKILVAGTGGVGGYFGALLARAGHDVAFLARGAHLEAIRRDGLKVRSLHGDFEIRPAASGRPEDLPEPECVLVAVKHYDLQATARQLRAVVREGTAVVPLMNGIDPHEVLQAALGGGRTAGGTCSVASRIEAPGVIRQESRMQRVIVGAQDGRPDEVLFALVAAWCGCGVDAIQTDDIVAALWSKFIFIASFGGVTALARSTAGEVRAAPAARAVLLEAMHEVDRVGRAVGARLPQDAVEQAMAIVEALEPGVTSSLQRDVADGRRFELEAFSGTIVRLASKHALEVPVHAAIYGFLRPMLTRAEDHAGSARVE